MSSEKIIFWETIKVFSNEGILPYVILVGSWVEVIYEIAMFPSFEASLHTKDVDFLVKNIRLPREKVDVIKALEKHGYITDIDPLTEVTKFYKDGILELEFLVRQLGQGQVEAYRVESMGIKAEGLRNMNILADHTVTVVVEGYQITVPKPAAYIIEKLIINENRGTKREKDIRAVQRILEVIHQCEEEVETLQNIYNDLNTKQKAKVNLTCQKFRISLFL